MTILEDVNQKVGQHENISEWCREHGIILRRQKLNVGDYIITPGTSVDTKQGMQEVYSDIVSDHERFRAECIRAQEDGTRLVILIENTDGLKTIEDVANWVNPRYVKWEKENHFLLEAQKSGKFKKQRIPPSPVPVDRLQKMMEAMTAKYGVEWQFCTPEESGERIFNILSEKG